MNIIQRQLHVFTVLVVYLQIAFALDSISQPSLNFNDFGDRLGLLGSFNSLSFYSYLNSSSLLNASTSNSLFLRNTSSNLNLRIADINGIVTQLYSLSSDTVVLNGNFTKLNNQLVISPVIFNITNNQVTHIIPTDSHKRADIPSISNGNVNTILIDKDLIYLGGDFEFNSTHGVAIYNQTSKELSSTPFQGFGRNSSVNAIAKILDPQDEDLGSIIFGGSFDTLGLKDLLVHNISSNATTNSSNSSVITAEQQISLKHGTFSNVNGESSNDDSLLVCPKSNPDWKLVPGQGGQWAVELPNEMKGLTPTKARVYLTSGSNGAKTFRIYSYPNNGIMNLSYIDPNTNELKFCDAWCPLLQFSELQSITEANKRNSTDEDDDSDKSVFIDDDGSFATYYDPSTKTKTLGYGSNYQEFSFTNMVSIDKVGVTIVDWYGSAGSLGGLELYSNAIIVYGNNTLNDPNCGESDSITNNIARIDGGTFEAITSLDSSITTTDYIVSIGNDAKITLFPNISYDGNYSITMSTPGCILDNSCNKRSIVNVTVIDNEDNMLTSKLIYQNNDYDKFDYLFYGGLNGTSTSDGKNRIEISFHDVIIQDTTDPWVVIDKVTATIVSLDNYFDKNLTNSTSLHGELVHLSINGLFEYSIANFSDFDESLVSITANNKTQISKRNTFVGNSSINVLSSQLSKDTKISEISLQNSTYSLTLLVLGEFTSDSKNLTLSNSNLITLNINSYNSVANDTDAQISLKRKRALGDPVDVLGCTFNNTISSIVSYNGGSMFLGAFSVSNNGNSSIRFNDMSNNNKSVSSINNIVYHSNGQWYGFGNDFVDEAFDQFVNITINEKLYYVFSSSDSSKDSKIWDNSASKWFKNDEYQLNINQAVNMNGDQQILSGESLNIMDFYNRYQAYVQGNSNFSKYNFNVDENSDSITKSFYVNSSLSIIGGKFNSGLIENVGLIDNTNSNSSARPLQGNLTWDPNTVIQSLYVDSSDHYLFIGMNGSISINDSDKLAGLVIYDLKNNNFTSFQPAQLSLSSGGDLSIDSIVLYDKANQLMVGGNFDQAGSLDCVGVCIYDITNTRWINPQSDTSQSISGMVTDVKFYQSEQVLIGGNLTLNNNFSNFITYDFGKAQFGSKASLNTLGMDKPIQRFVINDENNNNLNGRLVSYGKDFVSGFDGSNWNRIDSEIDYDFTTKFTDLKLLELQKSNSNNNGTYFDKDKILALAGSFSLKEYGLVNVALYNGTNWIPYIYTATTNNQLGEINSLLIDDSFRFQSSDDLKKNSDNLSKGKVIGISLACAIGSTTLLGLLYIIPYFALFRKQKKEEETKLERIQESEMMNAVRPEDLFHEIDLQRHH
jgi:hypothetical protein